MATAQQQLKEAIETVRNWSSELSPYSVEYELLQLNDLDQNQHADLWAELRKALANNADLNNKAPKEFFRRPFLANEGHWWWDPSEWTADNS